MRNGYTAVLSHRSRRDRRRDDRRHRRRDQLRPDQDRRPGRSDRVAKYNQLIRIEEQLGDRAEYGGKVLEQVGMQRQGGHNSDAPTPMIGTTPAPAPQPADPPMPPIEGVRHAFDREAGDELPGTPPYSPPLVAGRRATPQHPPLPRNRPLGRRTHPRHRGHRPVGPGPTPPPRPTDHRAGGIRPRSQPIPLHFEIPLERHLQDPFEDQHRTTSRAKAAASSPSHCCAPASPSSPARPCSPSPTTSTATPGSARSSSRTSPISRNRSASTTTSSSASPTTRPSPSASPSDRCATSARARPS